MTKGLAYFRTARNFVSDVFQPRLSIVTEEVGEIHRLDHHKARISGRAHLADINEQLGLELPEPADFDTIGGLVIARLGRIPSMGDSVELNSVKITVTAATKRKVEEVVLESVDGIAAIESAAVSDSPRGVPQQHGRGPHET